MKLLQAVPALVATALLAVASPDCISPLFSTQESRDCCAQGDCEEMAQPSACCQAAVPDGGRHFFPEVPVQPGPAVLAAADVVNTAPHVLLLSDLPRSCLGPPHAPGDSVSLPLLI